nr:MAG TPA: hypothetical protein [Caudoviricetes sp.]
MRLLIIPSVPQASGDFYILIVFTTNIRSKICVVRKFVVSLQC